MRFKKGSKVEVLSKKEVPSGSWQCAEIICCNGHNYTVRYDISGGATVVEKVSKKDIRPCPPPLEVSEDWVPGDLVEVFHDFAWKLATISDVSGKKHVLVRLLGSSWDCKVSKFDVRVRRSWQDDQWVVIGKSSKNNDTEKREEFYLDYNQKPSLKAPKTSTKSLKRRSPYSTSKADNAPSRAYKKPTVIKASNPLMSAQKLNTALPRDELCFRQNRFPETSLVRCSFAQTNNAVSVTSSVGSCSVNIRNVSAGPSEPLDSGDAESVFRSSKGNEDDIRVFPAKEALAAEIHRLELNAYRCTMEALHASGPLSWEQEEMMTNLRLSLHISNDEHLMELKNLVSADTSVNLR